MDENRTFLGGLLVATTDQNMSVVSRNHTMHLLLIFGIVLLPKAFTLKCYECMLGSCTNAEKECPAPGYQCGALRVISNIGGSQIGDVNVKSCALPEQCVEGSLNFGFTRTVVTSKCCTSNLCNVQTAPDPSKSYPNGKKCFSCEGKHCTATLNCQGNEDYCISAKVYVGDEKMTMKGCASKLMCSNEQTAQIAGTLGSEIDCCLGDYCNSAIRTSAGLLLLVAPLISLVMFS